MMGHFLELHSLILAWVKHGLQRADTVHNRHSFLMQNPNIKFQDFQDKFGKKHVDRQI